MPKPTNTELLENLNELEVLKCHCEKLRETLNEATTLLEEALRSGAEQVTYDDIAQYRDIERSVPQQNLADHDMKVVAKMYNELDHKWSDNIGDVVFLATDIREYISKLKTHHEKLPYKSPV